MLLTAVLLLSVCPVLANDAAQVVFTVSDVDEDGRFTVDVVLYDAVFNVFQTALLYNPDAVCLVDRQTGAPAEDALDFCEIGQTTDAGEALLSDVRTEVDAEHGLLYLALMVNISQKAPNELVDERHLIHTPETGVHAYTLYFKKISQQDADFGIATAQDPYYDLSLPTGLILTDGSKTLAAQVTFAYPDQTVAGLTVEESAISVPELTDKQKRDRRKADTVILQIGNYAAVADGILFWIDDDNKHVVPYIDTASDRTLVPVRFIAERMGAEVQWEDATRTITIQKGETTLVMQVGSTAYTKNGAPMEMDAAPCITEDARTFVPLRFVSEALDRAVFWDENNRAIVLSPAEMPWKNEDSVEKSLLNDSLLIMSPLIRDMK